MLKVKKRIELSGVKEQRRICPSMSVSPSLLRNRQPSRPGVLAQQWKHLVPIFATNFHAPVTYNHRNATVTCGATMTYFM
jgi:hypothetical protein